MVTLGERLFDAATALAGSDPPSRPSSIRGAFEDAGITSGLSASTARALILSTMVGTANVLEETGVSCSELRRMVTSPGGTAAAGLAQMERSSVRGGIIDGVSPHSTRPGQLG